MCSIAGGFGSPDRERIEEMLAMMRHRGEKFAYGTGTSQVLSRWAEKAFTGRKKRAGGSREEVLYRSIFRRHFPQIASAWLAEPAA